MSDQPKKTDDTTRADGIPVGAGVRLLNPRLHVVLVEPEIPNNTGNIGRTCVTTGCRLHLVHPLAFDIDEKACRRAGLDYWPRLDLVEHERAERYLEAHPPRVGGSGRSWFLTSHAKRSVFDAPIAMGDHLVFGRESRGIDASVLDRVPESQQISVPMVPGERSLNLSTCVAVCVYAAIRNMYGSGEVRLDADGRIVGA
ncbi:MAG: tRNA (cytidine(34)-2'-O)-methyltransferase [Phycisphaerales bacterium JB052]